MLNVFKRISFKPTILLASSLLFITSLLALPGCTGVAGMNAVGGDNYRAEIRRTQAGIPHIKADDLGGLGFGTLYAMAEDNPCIMARHYRLLSAEKSRYLGPGDGNLESDFFYQLLIDRGVGTEKISSKLEELFVGAAAGYNHYLETVGVDNLPDASCRGQEWVRQVEVIDVKRVSRIEIFLDHMRPMIVAAQPPAEAIELSQVAPKDDLWIASAVDQYMEIPKQGGSNALAVGNQLSVNGRGMLLANPHMAWHEEFQRFYPMQQTVPGMLDVFGANMVGRPRVGFGTTADVAWTSTVSTAKRFTFYRLELVPGNPTRYVFDGDEYDMIAETVTVPVKTASGNIEQRSHTFYSTHFGAMLVASEFFHWTHDSAFAVQLMDPAWRGEVSTFDQYAAKTVKDLKQVHNRNQFLTVNLVAADRAGNALYTDPGPVPHISDEKMAACSIMHGAAFDGTRSECLWGNDADAAVPGVFGPSKMPLMYRNDYVLNSNDSYWITHARQPLEGYAKILGTERQERTLRTRSAFKMVNGYRQQGRMDLQDLQDLVFANENYAGMVLRDDVVAMCRNQPEVTLESGDSINLEQACDVLADWDLYSNVDSRGSHIFREFLAAANNYEYIRIMPKGFRFLVPFDEKNPLTTPRQLDRENNPLVLPSLAKGVQRLLQAGVALDARLGDVQTVTRAGVVIPIHGGQEIEGVYNKVESDWAGEQAYPEVTRWSSSWVMASTFGENGPQIRAILTYSLSANPDSPWYYDQTEMFSKKQWLHIPFNDADIEAAAIKSYTVQQ